LGSSTHRVRSISAADATASSTEKTSALTTSIDQRKCQRVASSRFPSSIKQPPADTVLIQATIALAQRLDRHVLPTQIAPGMHRARRDVTASVCPQYTTRFCGLRL
jgi:hypothetical protein